VRLQKKFKLKEHMKDALIVQQVLGTMLKECGLGVTYCHSLLLLGHAVHEVAPHKQWLNGSKFNPDP
jgi:hypothetical protein